MEEELRQLKSALRSLAVSSPTQLNVRSLLRDYRAMLGAPVPLARFGYRDALAFLRDKCSDCFLIEDGAVNPVLTVIVPDSVKHIDNFVQKQKVTSVAKSKGKRRSIPEAAIKETQSNEIVRSFRASKLQPKPAYTLEETTETNHIHTHTNEEYETHHHTNNNDYTFVNIDTNNDLQNYSHNGLQNDLQNYSHINLQNDLHNDLVNAEHANKQIEENAIDNGVCSSTALHNFMKKRMPMCTSSQYLDSESAEKSSLKDNDSGRLTSSSNNSTKRAQLEELKMEVIDLMADHPEGIWCTELMRRYREKYGRSLNFSRAGFTSVVEFACALEGGVRLAGGAGARSGDLLLQDARRPPARPAAPLAPAAACTPRALRPARPGRAIMYARQPVNPDDALPGIDYEPDVFPADCMSMLDSIPAQSVRELVQGALLEVILGEVYSPTHFWMLRLGPQHNIAMEDIMDQMNEYYRGAGRERALAAGALRVGQYCACCYEGDWHRALIVKLLDCDTVKVRHVDYATVGTVSAGSLRALRREWGALPAQALRGRLAAVRPPAAARRWPRSAAAHFLARVRERRLVADLVAVDYEESILEVLLIDTSTDEDVCISSELISAGHADPRPDSALSTSECYLYPRFDALETGDTPNFAEIHNYLRDGISLDFVEDYRRHVPPPAPLSPPSTPAPPAPPRPSPSPPASSASYQPPAPQRRPGMRSLSHLAPQPAADPPRAQSQYPLERSFHRDRTSTSPPPLGSSVALANCVPLLLAEPPAPRLQHHPPPAPASKPPPTPPPAPPCPQAYPLPGYGYGYPGPPPVPFYPPMYPTAFAPPPPPFPMCPQLPFSPAPHEYVSPPLFPCPLATPGPQHPRGGPAPSGRPPPPRDRAVSLPAADCEIFRLLSRVDPAAAYKYMVDALSRASPAVFDPAEAAVAKTKANEAMGGEARLVSAETQTESGGAGAGLRRAGAEAGPSPLHHFHEIASLRPPPGFERVKPKSV